MREIYHCNAPNFETQLNWSRSKPDINHSSARKAAFEIYARDAFDVAEVAARLPREGAQFVTLDDGVIKFSNAPPLWAAMSSKPRLYSRYPP